MFARQHAMFYLSLWRQALKRSSVKLGIYTNVSSCITMLLLYHTVGQGYKAGKISEAQTALAQV